MVVATGMQRVQKEREVCDPIYSQDVVKKNPTVTTSPLTAYHGIKGFDLKEVGLTIKLSIV